MPHLRSVHLVIACLALVDAGRASAAPRTVAVLPLQNLGVGEDAAASLLGFLRAEVGRLPGVTLVDPGRATAPVGAGCRGEPKCLAAAGVKLGAAEVVYGTVAAMGDQYSIDLKCVTVRPVRVQGRVTEMLSGERERLIDGVRAAAYKLLLPASYVGSIQVELPERGAEVFVDGRGAGTTPLSAPIGGLAPGRHALKIVKPGFADFDRWVEVQFARVAVVRVDLRNSAIAGVMFQKTPLPGVEFVPPPPPPPPVASGAPPPVAPPPPPPPIAALTAPGPGASVPGPAAPGAVARTGSHATAAIVLAAGGAALVGGGAAFGVLSAKDRRTVTAMQIDGGPVAQADAAKAAGLVRGVRTKAIAANALFAAGGTALLGAGALWLFGDTTAAVAPEQGGASVTVSGSF